MKYLNSAILLTVLLALVSLSKPSLAYLQESDLSAEQQKLVESLKQENEQLAGLSQKDPSRLSKQIEVSFEGDIAILTVSDIWFYPSKSAVQDYAYESIYFNGHSDEVKNIMAVTLRDDGKIRWFDNDNIKTLGDDTYDVFTESKRHVINYPGVFEGSLTGLRYEIHTDMTKLESHWSQSLFLQTYFHQKDLKIVINKDSDKKTFYNNPSELVKCKEKAKVITCIGTDIPKLDYEENMLFKDEAPQFKISHAKDWASVKTGILSGFTRAQANNSMLDDFMPKLILPGMSFEAKIDAIHSFVSRDIRYVSMSEAGNAVTPHSINETLDNRYGDCKDKTALLLEMLRQLQIKAWPVLIATDRRDAAKLVTPSSNYFNHVIACFEFNEQTYCIDATDSTSDWRYTSGWNQGKVALALTEDGMPSNIPEKAYRWDLENNTKIEILANGGQTESQHVTFKNEYGAYWRAQLEGLDETEVKEWGVELFQSIVSQDMEPTVSLSGIDILSDDIVFTSQTEYEPYLKLDEDLDAFEYEPWIANELNTLNFDNKHFVTYFPGISARSTVNIDVSKLWKLISYPATLNLTTKYGSLVRELVVRENHQLEIVTILKMPSKHLSPAELKSFNEVLDVFNEQSLISFTGLLE
jgi:hypothetical protein